MLYKSVKVEKNFGMKTNIKKIKFKRTLRRKKYLNIVLNEQNLETFNYLCSIITNNKRYIKAITAMAK